MRRALFIVVILALTVSVVHGAAPPLKDEVTDMELVFVKGGCFQMGDEPRGTRADAGPIHTVCVNDFYMGKYEVTQKQWMIVMKENPSFFPKGDNFPVERVTFHDVQAFIKKLVEVTGKAYRLPTEAEWEYAARGGGRKTRYAGTNNDKDLKNYAWYEPNGGGKTHPVGTRMPNELGLYDMSGNVWEWVSDWFDPNYYKVSPKENPTGPEKGTMRVTRGGSWFSDKEYIHTANRGRAGENARHSGITGFRVVLPVE